MKQNYKFLVGMCLLISNYILAQPTVPANPASGNANNCTTNSSILTCPANSSGVTTSFTSGAYNRGNNGSHLGVGAIWRYSNITTVSGVQVNAEVKIDAISNASLNSLDDDAALDQNNNSIASFFAPRITSASSSSSTRGYVQFTMTFFDGTSGNGYTTQKILQSLNFVHLDIDGNGSSSSWFRETGNALSYGSGNPTVIANSPTELVAYNYTDNTTSPGGSFVGYAGSVYERSGVSLCSEVAVAYRYNSTGRSSITFRMGYDFKKGSSNLSATTRQYGATFGCFNFPQEAPLPVKLLTFSGTYRNQATTLNWQTANEIDFDHYEIERSSNGSDFASVGTQAARGNNMSTKEEYQFSDNLSNVNGNVFYYRLKMVDIDGKSVYSNVVLIRKDEKSINGISIAPNPVVNGMANIRFTSSTSGAVELRVVDLTGKVVLRQQNQIYEGNNSISLNDLSRLQPGIYTIQVSDGELLVAAKFSLIK